MAGGIVFLLLTAAFAAAVIVRCHPAGRYLKWHEMPMALYVCLLGRRYRRQLAGILVHRREAAARPRKKSAAGRSCPVAAREHVARALQVPASRVSVRSAGPGSFEVLTDAVAGLYETVRQGSVSMRDLDRPHRNPWAAGIDPELAAHKKRMAAIPRRGLSEDEKWAKVEASWKDIPL